LSARDRRRLEGTAFQYVADVVVANKGNVNFTVLGEVTAAHNNNPPN
jgi:hypothetical protein